jgi:hypothetical protein
VVCKELESDSKTPISVKQLKKSQSKCSKTSSESSSASTKSKGAPSYDEIMRYKEFYTTPVSALDPDTYSKYRTVRSMVVSQTWLTGWIKELYSIESDIIDATGKPL